MSWNYRVAKKVGKDFDVYGIVEVYYDTDGSVKGWTDFIDPNGWDDISDLKGTLELMLKAFEHPEFEVIIGEEV
jgi:hypothetical protein